MRDAAVQGFIEFEPVARRDRDPVVIASLVLSIATNVALVVWLLTLLSELVAADPALGVALVGVVASAAMAAALRAAGVSSSSVPFESRSWVAIDRLERRVTHPPPTLARMCPLAFVALLPTITAAPGWGAATGVVARGANVNARDERHVRNGLVALLAERRLTARALARQVIVPLVTRLLGPGTKNTQAAVQTDRQLVARIVAWVRRTTDQGSTARLLAKARADLFPQGTLLPL